MDALTIAAASGLKSRIDSLDLLANNLANTSTSGYKNDREFYSLYSSIESDDGVSGNPSSTLPTVERQWTDFSQGEMQSTGNAMDIALGGPGFFVVNGPSGPLYTRNGNLQILPSGELATADGYPLTAVGGGTIQVASGQPIQVSSNGTVTQNNRQLGQIQVVTFKSTSSLTKAARTCFGNADASNPPVPATSPDVQQGKIEGSNVGVAQSAMRLVGVMRQFEMLQKAIGVSTDMDTKSIQEVARVS